MSLRADMDKIVESLRKTSIALDSAIRQFEKDLDNHLNGVGAIPKITALGQMQTTGQRRDEAV